MGEIKSKYALASDAGVNQITAKKTYEAPAGKPDQLLVVPVFPKPAARIGEKSSVPEEKSWYW